MVLKWLGRPCIQSATSWKSSSSTLVFHFRGPERSPVLRNVSLLGPFLTSLLHSSPRSSFCLHKQTVILQRAFWNIFIMIFQALFERVDFTGWLLISFLVLLLTDVIRNWRPHNFPPGPWAVPFLGNVFTGVNFKTMEKVSYTLYVHLCIFHE